MKRSLARLAPHGPIGIVAGDPAPLLATFTSFRAADSYASGFVGRRVVVARAFFRQRFRGRLLERRRFVVCSRSTARRRGWPVVAS